VACSSVNVVLIIRAEQVKLKTGRELTPEEGEGEGKGRNAGEGEGGGENLFSSSGPSKSS
jgi:hypothetical protein